MPGGGSEYSESRASLRMAVRFVADREDAEDWNRCIDLADILPIPSADWVKVRNTRGFVTPVRRWIVATSFRTRYAEDVPDVSLARRRTGRWVRVAEVPPSSTAGSPYV